MPRGRSASFARWGQRSSCRECDFASFTTYGDIVADGRIQGISCLIQLDPEVLGGIEGPSGRDQSLRKIGIDPPIAHLVGMGEGVPGDRPTESHVVELGLGHPEAGLEVPQTLPVGELAKAMQRNWSQQEKRWTL